MTPTASLIWRDILTESEKRKKTEDLVQVVIEEFPNNEELKNIFVEATEHQPLQPVENFYLDTVKSHLTEGDTLKARRL